MGRIHDDVYSYHVASHTDEEPILRPFLQGFDVTWGRERKAYNTTVSAYYLNPERHMRETFGFSNEILLVVSKYESLEPRAIRAAEQFLNDESARGRLERLTYFLVSFMSNPEEWVRSYMAANRESRLVVAFSAKELPLARSDHWYIRNRIMEQLFSRDLFDFRLPLAEDTYFFGREDFLIDYRDAARRGENRGLFGLRKTGKTSFLFKLERSIRDQDGAYVVYYDCKSPSVRQLTWHELLATISTDVAKQCNLAFRPPVDTKLLATEFTDLLSKVPPGRRVALIFDEIEYISPQAQEDRHWGKDYIPFWQTIWAAQSRHRNLFVVLAGVNPSLVEIDRIQGVQNPLFGIVSYKYLTGLGEEETRRMLRVLGRRMGLRFAEGAIQYVYRRYGGHPLLTRLACSYVHQRSYLSKTERPIDVDEGDLRRSENLRDAELQFYCRHVVSELQEFYPDEYDLLEYLAAGRIKDFLDFALYPEYSSHLRAYGLVGDDGRGVPEMTIPVVGRYVALEEARRMGRKTILAVVPSRERAGWLQLRVEMLLTDIRELERLTEGTGLPLLYGPNSIAESHRLTALTAVEREEDFGQFINVCNQCFVEGIEAYGTHLCKPRYFWKEIAVSYPGLFEALHRIKVYRHGVFHVRLKAEVEAKRREFLTRDLEGRKMEQVEDVWFVLQQCVLDGLLSGLQVEISRLSN